MENGLHASQRTHYALHNTHAISLHGDTTNTKQMNDERKK